MRETKRRSVQIPANRTHQRRDYQRLEVLETSAVKRRGEILPLADMMVPTAALKDRQAGGQPGSLSLLFLSQAPSSVASLHLCVSPTSLCQSFASSLCLLSHSGDECSGHEFFTDSVGVCSGSGFAGLVVLEM